jgi:hypothetical protein
MESVPGDDDLTNVAHECHVVARKDDPKVARSVGLLSEQEKTDHADLIENRHGFANIVLMCLTHSRVIDDPKQGYAVSDVLEIKRSHETAVQGTRTQLALREAQAEFRYAAIVDEWARRIGLDDWDPNVSPLVADGHPRIRLEALEAIEETRTWIFKTVWPKSNLRLEEAFENFRRVAQDLGQVLTQHPHEHLAKQGFAAIARFYNDARYWPLRGDPDHAALDEMYEFYSLLVEDLAYELTRSVNLICDIVRQTIDPLFRVNEGVATLTAGPFMEDLSFRTGRPHYRDTKDLSPYPGLRPFLTERANRDIVCGAGGSPPGVRLPGDPLGFAGA